MDPVAETLAYYNHTTEARASRRDAVETAAHREFLTRVPAGGRILDAGCGSGSDLEIFIRRGMAAEGVDGSEAMIERAKESGAPVRCADLRLLSFPPETFDGIWAHQSLIHLDADGCRRTLAGFFRFLKPAGALFVSIQTASEMDVTRTDSAEGAHLRTTYLYPREEFASLLRQCGFQIMAEGRPDGDPDQVAFIATRVTVAASGSGLQF